MNNEAQENRYVKGRIPIVAFCSPSPPFNNYPDRITEKTFSYLKELGVDILLGHDEFFGKNESLNAYVFKAMELCEKFGIEYCVRMEIMHEFVAIENCSCNPQYKPFKLLSDIEREELKCRFLSQLDRCMQYKACIGVAFFDEAGTEMFDGIKFARDVFKEKYPDKLFYINNVSCLSNDGVYYYGQYLRGVKKIFASDPIFPELSFENRFKRYEIFMDRFYEKLSDDDVYSSDCYAIQNLGGLKHTVNKALYDMPYCAVSNAKKHDRHYWNFIQVSGGWDDYCRLPEYSEFALQINVSLALGCKGIELFPVCFPKDFIGTGAFNSPIDIYGEKFSTYEPLKNAISAIKIIREELANADFMGFFLSGAFTDAEKEGYTVKQLLSLKNGEAIFAGSLDWTLLLKNGTDFSVESDIQVAVGCFKEGNTEKYLIVNNSVITENNVKIKFTHSRICRTVYKKQVSVISGKEIKIDELPAGECFLVAVKE